MKNRGLINIILSILAFAVAFIIIFDFVTKRPTTVIDNPYRLETSEYEHVNDSEIIGEEIKTIQLADAAYVGMAYHEGLCYVISEEKLTVINDEGIISFETFLPEIPTAIAVDDCIWLAFRRFVANYSFDFQEIGRWADYDSRSYITSLALKDEYVYVADAGNRIVYQCNREGQIISRIGEKDEDANFGGFVIPSPYFDIAVSDEGILWASNPGKHGLVSFNGDGSYRSSFSKASIAVDGFCGCCNPSHFALMNDGSFITGEKTILRVKRYNEHGDYKGVIAAPKDFDKASLPSVICVDENDNAVLLDVTKSRIRVFNING